MPAGCCFAFDVRSYSCTNPHRWSCQASASGVFGTSFAISQSTWSRSFSVSTTFLAYAFCHASSCGHRSENRSQAHPLAGGSIRRGSSVTPFTLLSGCIGWNGHGSCTGPVPFTDQASNSITPT